MGYQLDLQSAPPPADKWIAAEPSAFGLPVFYPPVRVLPLYDQYRVPAEIPAAIVEEQLKLAMVRCMASLATYRAAMVAAGYTTLALVPGQLIAGEHEKEVLWRRAVYCEAKAELLKETQTVDRRKDAENLAKSGEETEDKYREFAAAALRQIADMGRIDVELI